LLDAENIRKYTDAPFKMRMKLCSAAWHALSESDRKIYQDMTETDKTRVELERAGLLPSGSVEFVDLPEEERAALMAQLVERGSIMVALAKGVACESSSIPSFSFFFSALNLYGLLLSQACVNNCIV